MTALIDTPLLVDYLLGRTRAERAIDAHPHRSITVETWLQAMALAPASRREPTRAFLRSFERLSLNEAIADEALRLIEANADLALHRAMNWAAARMNRLLFVTVDDGVLRGDEGIVLVAERRPRSTTASERIQ